MAEAIFNNLAKGNHHAYSAGTWVYDKEGKSLEGQKIEEVDEALVVINSLKELGIDVSKKQRNQVTPEMIREADKIVVMAEEHTIPDFLRISDKVIYWEIENPKGMDQLDTNKIRDQIADRVRKLVSELD